MKYKFPIKMVDYTATITWLNEHFNNEYTFSAVKYEEFDSNSELIRSGYDRYITIPDDSPMTSLFLLRFS